MQGGDDVKFRLVGEVGIVGAAVGDELVFELVIEFCTLGEVNHPDGLIVGNGGRVFVGVDCFRALELVKVGALGVMVFVVRDSTESIS